VFTGTFFQNDSVLGEAAYSCGWALNVAILKARISFRYGVLTSKKDCQWGSDSMSCPDSNYSFSVYDSVEWSSYFIIK